MPLLPTFAQSCLQSSLAVDVLPHGEALGDVSRPTLLASEVLSDEPAVLLVRD